MNLPTQRSATVTPAYGKTYRGRDAVLADWKAGKDFMINTMQSTAYCSIRDVPMLEGAGFTHLTFRNSNGNILVNVPINYGA